MWCKNVAAKFNPLSRVYEGNTYTCRHAICTILRCCNVGGPWSLTFWLWNWCAMQHVSYGTLYQFWWYYDYSFYIDGLWGQHGSDWSRNLMTLTYDLGGHGACGWCKSSSSIGVPTLKFVGLGIRKMVHDVRQHGPANPDLWSFDLETGMRVASKVGNLPSKFGDAGPLGTRRIIRYVRDGRTDGG